MKKFALFMLILLVSGVLFAQQIGVGRAAWVSTKTADLKNGTGFFAGRVGVLQMGDQVTVLQISGGKVEVRTANGALSGWVAAGSLSARRIVAAGSSATVTEVALAGKGFTSTSEAALAGNAFTQEVEDAYKTGDGLNYADVDRIEAIAVTQENLYAFVTEGRLYTGE